ncbi:GNAT family N-acetyltransferase [Streptomyces bambusae]|uniref:GNAT family N-acetyltransferase n=1 Tax=Streptomyces bambusae TaxID=1550616 RepID=UPI001CFF1174|nr:GNAT family N-acetyltransferase [Streptomyces bambusae]MCB5164807.1 GNAT family N-acetyltransferase [Streptomyces bambusae]
MIISDDALPALERYYDTVPRLGGARAEDFGPLTLFVQEDPEGWQYYARPALGGGGAVTPADVTRVLERQRELKVPQAFEWVAETTPGLRAAVEAAGVPVHAHPLMVLDPAAETVPPHPEVRLLGADDPMLLAAVTVPTLAFAAPGTALGEAGVAELGRQMADPGSEARRTYVARKLAAGTTALAAVVRDGVVLCSGQYLPAGDVAEVVGVGTLPAARRQGFALGVTAALVAAAREAGAATVFLSAGDEDVARIYTRAGFRRAGTALIAEIS